MNNVEAIDYAVSDWVEDNDVCISRKSSEYPRLNMHHKSLFDDHRPWGNLLDPVLVDFKEHPIFTQNSYEPGVWYYGGIPGSDHLDLCGLPPIYEPLRTLLGIEYRTEMWRYIYLRLKMLDDK